MENITQTEFDILVRGTDRKEELFLNSDHMNLFNEYLRRDGTHSEDRERKALFFILSGAPDLISKGINRIYDFTDHHLHFGPDEEEMEKYLEKFSLCSSSSSLLRLACNLYSGLYPSKTVNDTFSNLDEDNIHLALTAIRIRFESNVI
jgi:hypothetical protein